MNEFVKNVSFRVSVFQRRELGPEWDTQKFNDRHTVIPFARLYYPLEGNGIVTWQGRRINLVPGKIYLIPPYAPVQVKCPRRLVKYWGHFNAFMLDSDLDIFTVFHPPCERDVENPELCESLLSILSGLFNGRSGDAQRRLSPLDEMEAGACLTLLLSPFLRSMGEGLDASSLSPASRLGRLLAHIEMNLAGGLSLEKLGEFANLNPTYLSNFFAREMGVPLMRYCNERRVRRAINLMWGTNCSFSEIAYKVGAENVTAFSRLFKRFAGVSPQELRRRVREGGKLPPSL